MADTLSPGGAKVIADDSTLELSAQNVMSVKDKGIDTAQLEDDAATDPKVDDGLTGNGNIFLTPFGYDSIVAGTWAWLNDDRMPQAGMFSNQAAAATADELNFKAFLEAGTYSMAVVYTKGNSGGIVDILIDGSEETSIDTYDASTVPGLVDRTTGITVAARGIKTIRMVVDGKNASSSAHNLFLHYIILWRTA